jgi:glycosyltransferase involved in cell wall biosynthesis
VRILVATSDVPFVEGGHRVIAQSLVRALQQAGHTAEILTTPQNRFGRQFAAYLATWLTDASLTGTGEAIDRVISTRFPAYVLRHPQHVCWLIHRMREYYDLWDEWASRLSWKGKIKESVRKRTIRAADKYFLKNNVRHIFAISKTIQQDLLRWGNISSEVLYPPAPPRNYHTKEYGNFIFCPARLTPLKRVSLLIEALSETKDVHVSIAGDGPERRNLEDIIRRHSLQDRVDLLGYVNEEQLVDLYSRCRAVYYAPFREDYGMVILEAFSSKKCVITATDSAGATELVEHRGNGIVADPDPLSIAKSLQELMDDPALAQKYGEAGHNLAMKITWEQTISRLLAV